MYLYYPNTYIKRLDTSNENIIIIDSDDKNLYEENFQKSIIKHKVKLMYITLYADIHYYCHYILNPNIISLTQKFSLENYTKSFLGPQYFILDDKFKNIKPNKAVTQKKPSLFRQP